MTLGKTNHRGVFTRKIFSRKRERAMSSMLVGVLAAIGAIGLMIFIRELPSLRRYMRIERM
jgi:hypothetical protein